MSDMQAAKAPTSARCRSRMRWRSWNRSSAAWRAASRSWRTRSPPTSAAPRCGSTARRSWRRPRRVWRPSSSTPTGRCRRGRWSDAAGSDAGPVQARRICPPAAALANSWPRPHRVVVAKETKRPGNARNATARPARGAPAAGARAGGHWARRALRLVLWVVPSAGLQPDQVRWEPAPSGPLL